MAIECGSSTLIASTEFGAIAAKVHCRKAGCEECAPLLRAQLIAKACQGEPNRFITWTSMVRSDQTPVEAYRELIKAQQHTIRYARHRLKVPPEDRWKIPNGYKSAKRELQVIRYAREDDAAGLTSINYFRTTEATKRGWPHLHMVARCPYIPQEWLSWQMGKRLGSPVVDIRAIGDRFKRVAYIVNYITKDENRFGNSRRYSFSQKYKLPPKEPYIPIAPPGTRFFHEKKQLHQFLTLWHQQNHAIWRAGPRWHGYGVIVDSLTGEIWPRPPNAVPYEVGDACEA